MSKTVVIGDVHGLDTWRKFVKWPWSRAIFMGDYCDPYGEMNDQKVIANLKRIIRLKKKHPKRIILLLGNHDMHYFSELVAPSSRYNYDLAPQIGALFQENLHLFQFAYQTGNTLFTHAGVSQNWWDDCFKGDITKNIADQLNHPTLEQLHAMGQCGWARRGPDKWGGIFWADATEMENPLKGIHQVVGHTRMRQIETQITDNQTTVTFCDCLHHNQVYNF